MRNQAVRYAFAVPCFLAVVALGHVPRAAAYDPDLLCAYPEDPIAPRWSVVEPVAMCAPRAIPERDVPMVPATAREALERARRLAGEGRHLDAVLALRIVERAMPSLADRIALEEAGYRMAAGPDALACAAFERAAESPERSVALHGEIGRARCLLAIADRRGIAAMHALERSYPELPYRNELSLLLARAHETWGQATEAARIYRQLELASPGSAHAERAHTELERMRAAGADVREPTLTEQVTRAERLTNLGYHELARPEIERLRAMDLPRPLAQQLARSAARLARVEGRWEDAQALLREAQGHPALAPEDVAAMEQQAQDLALAAVARDEDSVRRQVRSSLGGRAISRQPTLRLMGALRVAARGGLRDVVDELVREIGRRPLPPGARFDAAILAAGTADDALVAPLFASARSHPSLGIAARYHHARTLERLGQIDEARAEYRHVIAHDDPRLPYYALWARVRVRDAASQARTTAEVLPIGVSCSEGPYTPLPAELAGKTGDEPSTPAGRSRSAEVEGAGEPDEPSQPSLPVDPSPAYQLTPEQMVALLTPVAQAHGAGYPWIERAIDLVHLGELDAASDELHEAYVAWHDARGSGSLRSGLVSVLRGATAPRMRVTPETWRERRALSSDARVRLARVSAALGDHGLAIRFRGGFSVAGPRPRAHEELVEESARRHGLEPELLFAVMRVESVYNPRIISYAGAIGLMQIMPRTGRLIAHRLGRHDFTIDQLLDPATNIDFAAWYLASLIERFDGRLPLAIASYNGGPHNVRRWMRDHAATMPLDAFLERIPFTQTHRYVRRVLTHYAAYRAQRGRPLASLDVALPSAEPDPLAF